MPHSLQHTGGSLAGHHHCKRTHNERLIPETCCDLDCDKSKYRANQHSSKVIAEIWQSASHLPCMPSFILVPLWMSKVSAQIPVHMYSGTQQQRLTLVCSAPTDESLHVLLTLQLLNAVAPQRSSCYICCIALRCHTRRNIFSIVPKRHGCIVIMSHSSRLSRPMQGVIILHVICSMLGPNPKFSPNSGSFR